MYVSLLHVVVVLHNVHCGCCCNSLLEPRCALDSYAVIHKLIPTYKAQRFMGLWTDRLALAHRHHDNVIQEDESCGSQ